MILDSICHTYSIIQSHCHWQAFMKLFSFFFFFQSGWKWNQQDSVFIICYKKNKKNKVLNHKYFFNFFCLFFFFYQLCLGHLHAAEYYAVLCRVAPGERRRSKKRMQRKRRKVSKIKEREMGKFVNTWSGSSPQNKLSEGWFLHALTRRLVFNLW